MSATRFGGLGVTNSSTSTPRVQTEKRETHEVIVSKTVTTVTEIAQTAVEVYLSECEDYITMMIDGISIASISKKTLKLVVNDLDYAPEEDNHEFRNITKW